MPSRDIIFDLIEAIESQGHNYVLGIIKKSADKTDGIDIFTNGSKDGLTKLLFVLKEHQKSVKVNKDSIIKEIPKSE